MTTLEFEGFRPELFTFLTELAENNDREWFTANKLRYEIEVQQPALAFIRALAPHLARISSHIYASDGKVGGSLMRIYRDTRFSGDKTPYKTNVGIYFRHVAGKGVHAPGLYVHIAPDGCFLGVGLWRPDPPALARIRAKIDEERDRWLEVRDDPAFRAVFNLTGDSLQTPPRGFPKDHPLLEDLKRKDFTGVRDISRERLLAPDVVEATGAAFAASRPFMAFLCEALDLPF